MTDQLGDDVADQRPHRGHDLTGRADPIGGPVSRRLGRRDQIRRVLAARPVRVRGLTHPVGDIRLDQVLHLGIDRFQLSRDVLPRLRVRLDLIRITGQRIQRVRHRADVLHQPTDTGRKDRTERIQRHAQRVQTRPHRAHDARSPITRLDRLLRVVDRLRDLNTAERLRRILTLRHQRITHHNPQNQPTRVGSERTARQFSRANRSKPG
ncbi:hypothetical protein [Saccharopolyspora dendranthemae]|uniref:hypothetical protein n=1 Tax=Saccharopolyspora dendranthemae TaxID=1181886 RepID=UPI001645E75C|nr:hypothetical protein [Saccharopolyspora dendranthemae]